MVAQVPVAIDRGEAEQTGPGTARLPRLRPGRDAVVAPGPARTPRGGPTANGTH